MAAGPAHSAGPGTGSTFTVELPAAAQLPRPAAPAPGLRGDGRALRIMLVDDNVDAAATLSALLDAAGHLVRPSTTRASALAAALAAPPDVFILDIGMPLIDGHELARQLRAQPALARRRVFRADRLRPEQRPRIVAPGRLRPPFRQAGGCHQHPGAAPLKCRISGTRFNRISQSRKRPTGSFALCGQRARRAGRGAASLNQARTWSKATRLERDQVSSSGDSSDDRRKVPCWYSETSHRVAGFRLPVEGAQDQLGACAVVVQSGIGQPVQAHRAAAPLLRLRPVVQASARHHSSSLSISQEKPARPLCSRYSVQRLPSSSARTMAPRMRVSRPSIVAVLPSASVKRCGRLPRPWPAPRPPAWRHRAGHGSSGRPGWP
jgi:CheY-like chemotaxis protein